MEKSQCRMTFLFSLFCLHKDGSGVSSLYMAEVLWRQLLLFWHMTADSSTCLYHLLPFQGQTDGTWILLIFMSGSDENSSFQKSSADCCTALAQVLGLSVSPGSKISNSDALEKGTQAGQCSACISSKSTWLMSMSLESVPAYIEQGGILLNPRLNLRIPVPSTLIMFDLYLSFNVRYHEK